MNNPQTDKSKCTCGSNAKLRRVLTGCVWEWIAVCKCGRHTGGYYFQREAVTAWERGEIKGGDCNLSKPIIVHIQPDAKVETYFVDVDQRDNGKYKRTTVSGVYVKVWEYARDLHKETCREVTVRKVNGFTMEVFPDEDSEIDYQNYLSEQERN